MNYSFTPMILHTQDATKWFWNYSRTNCFLSRYQVIFSGSVTTIFRSAWKKDRFGCKFLGKTRVKLSYLGIEEHWGAKSTLTVSHVCCFCFYVEHLFQFLLWLVISFLMNWYKTSYYQNSRTDLKQTVLLYIEFAYLSGWYDHVQL